MKKLLVVLFLISPIFADAEYNGVQFEFIIHLMDGEEIHGYKYIAHAEDNETNKKKYESNPELILRNDFTSESREFGCYQNRLKYKYNEVFVYQLIDPIEVILSEVKSLEIIDMEMSSYAVTIATELKLKDANWLTTEPIAQYSEGESMCTYDVFIHKSGDVPTDVIDSIKFIIHQYEIRISEKELENEIDSDDEYEELMKPIYDKRNQELQPYFDKYKNLKTVSVSICTC